MFDKKAFIEAVKEPLRLLVLAVIPFGVAYFTELDYQWATFITILLRWADSYLHEMGKELSTKKEESVLLKGITRF